MKKFQLFVTFEFTDRPRYFIMFNKCFMHNKAGFVTSSELDRILETFSENGTYFEIDDMKYEKTELILDFDTKEELIEKFPEYLI